MLHAGVRHVVLEAGSAGVEEAVEALRGALAFGVVSQHGMRVGIEARLGGRVGGCSCTFTTFPKNDGVCVDGDRHTHTHKRTYTHTRACTNKTQNLQKNCTNRESVPLLSRLIRGFRNKYVIDPALGGSIRVA